MSTHPNVAIDSIPSVYVVFDPADTAGEDRRERRGRNRAAWHQLLFGHQPLLYRLLIWSFRNSGA